MKLNKHLSQNFLIDPGVSIQIVEETELEPDDEVLEIGPGAGALTEIILQQTPNITAVEIDPRWANLLKENFKETTLKVVEADFLKEPVRFFKNKKDLVVMGNIPYHISTPIIEALVENKKHIKKIILMTQKEYAEKLMLFEKGNSKLSYFAGLHFEVEILFIVPRTVFKPMPGVDSAIVRLIPRFDLEGQIKNKDIYQKILEAAFFSKRKKIRNNFERSSHLFGGKENIKLIEEKSGISFDKRAEHLTLEEYIRLANLLS
jgi:16S rRNA (adenine1518-N6/adenine1519-N6)-dimethyltransferase